jgi:hypothetical protein
MLKFKLYGKILTGLYGYETCSFTLIEDLHYKHLKIICSGKYLD